MAGGPAVLQHLSDVPLQHLWVCALHVQLPREAVCFSFWSPLASGLGWWETDASSVCHYCHPHRFQLVLADFISPYQFQLILTGSSLSLLFIQFPSWLLVWLNYSMISGSRPDAGATACTCCSAAPTVLQSDHCNKSFFLSSILFCLIDWTLIDTPWIF